MHALRCRLLMYEWVIKDGDTAGVITTAHVQHLTFVLKRQTTEDIYGVKIEDLRSRHVIALQNVHPSPTAPRAVS